MSHLHAWTQESGEWACADCEAKFEDAQEPVARRTDPDTSWEAAASTSKIKMTRTRQAIVDLLKEFGPMTDEEIWRGLEYKGLQGLTSLSGARTRRSELLRANKVYLSGSKTGKTGRRMSIWSTTKGV